jgi:hypothetical protein
VVGVVLFVREGYQERVNAEREARRGTLDPTYLVYTLGKMQIIKLREDYRRRAGSAFSLGEFHDRLLSYGMPPVKLIRQAMLGGDGGGDAGAGESTVEPQREVEFSVLATGYNSRHEGGRALQLITNQAEWERAWETIGRGSPGTMPEVNFNTRAVVLAHQGRKPTGGYGISVAAIRREGATLVVRVNEQSPGKGDIVTDALTSPFVAVSIPRPPDGTIAKFEDEVNKIEQNRNVNERSSPQRRRYGRRRRG